MRNSLLFIIIFTFGGCNSEQVAKDSVSSESESSPLITKYIIGKPNMAYFNAEKVVASRWGINIKHIFSGCMRSREEDKKRADFESSNIEAYEFYDKKFGIDWKVKFKAEVETQSHKKNR